MVNDHFASMTNILAEFTCQHVASVDNITLQGAIRLPNVGAGVRHRTGCKGMTLQNVQCGHSGFVFAHAAVRAAEPTATGVIWLELGDGINQLYLSYHRLPTDYCINQSA